MLWVARRRVWAGGGPATGGSTPPPVPILAAHDPAWTPAQPDIANGNAITLGGRFTASGSINLGGVAFYAPATIGGTYTAAIWQTTTDDDGITPGTGSLIGQVSAVAADVDPGWNYLALPVTVTAGLVWTVAVWTSTGRYVRTAATYSAGTVSGHGITFLQNGTDPNPPGLGSMFNGVFADDPGGAGIAYPPSTFQQADYGIDVWL